jgi:hypothetical protein
MNPEDTDKTEARRKFLKRVGSAAIVAPAVTLLLSAPSRKAWASGGNWDTNQHLHSGRVDAPTGQLTLIPQSQVRRVEAWIVQDSTGAIQRTVQTKNFVQDKWTAGEELWIDGDFQIGVAHGTALVFWRDANTWYQKQWEADITLS